MHTDFARVEHADAEDVAHLRRPGADDLRKVHEPDAHQPLGIGVGAPQRLFFTQCVVIDRS